MVERLGVQISSRTADVQAGLAATRQSLSSTASEAGDLSLSMRRLGFATDEASDELDEAGRAAATASPAFSSLAFSTNGLALSFGTLSSSLTLALIPALAALSTTLLPIVATITTLTGGAFALAGAFGAIVGSGLLAFGEKRAKQNAERLSVVRRSIRSLERRRRATGDLTREERKLLEQFRREEQQLEDQTSAFGGLQSAMADLKAELTPLIVEFGQQFVPLIEDAIDAIPKLVQRVLEALGGMGMFKEALRDFGEAAFNAIPDVVEFFRELAEDALPVARDFFSFLQDNAAGTFQEMLRITRRLAPQFMEFIDALVDALPELTEMGTILLEDILPPLSDLVRLLGKVAGAFADVFSSREFQTLLNVIKEMFFWHNKVVQSFSNFWIDVFNGVILPGLNHLIDVIQALPGDPFGGLENIEPLQAVDFGPMLTGDSGGSGGDGRDGRRGRTDPDGSGQRVVVTVDDEKFDAYVEDMNEQFTRRRNDRADRRTGTSDIR